jgi:hypothetical protein
VYSAGRDAGSPRSTPCTGCHRCTAERGVPRARVRRIGPITGRRHDLVEVIAAGPKAATLAEEARTRLLNQVDEKRHPRTNATVNQLLDRHFELVTLERSTLATASPVLGGLGAS